MTTESDTQQHAADIYDQWDHPKSFEDALAIAREVAAKEAHREAARASVARSKVAANIPPECVNTELKSALDTSAYLCRELPVGSETAQAAGRLHERLQRLFWATANTDTPQ